jgi:hypothetical protein
MVGGGRNDPHVTVRQLLLISAHFGQQLMGKQQFRLRDWKAGPKAPGSYGRLRGFDEK